MRKYSPEELRSRWKDGTMAVEEWDQIIEEHLINDRKKTNKVTAVPYEWKTAYTFPVNELSVSEEFIRRFANAIGNADPLFRDPAYGRNTVWGSMIAPPTFATLIAWAGSFPEKADVPGWNAFHGGTDHLCFKVIRPGDRFRVTNKYLGIEEKMVPEKPYRLFISRNKRTYTNDRDELVAIGIAHEIITAVPPGLEDSVKKTYKDRERHKYTRDELDLIHRFYDDELEGKNRRGSEIRYWEDVQEGNELTPLVKGPLDISDIVSYIGVGGYSMAFAIKWKMMKQNLGRAHIDPETGEHHLAIDWHYLDSMARVMGLPYAHSTGRQNEGNIGHLISNWMGDDGFVTRLKCEHRGIWFQGETLFLKGKVVRKYIDEGMHLVDVDVWSENMFSGQKCTLANATIKLVSKTN